MLAEVAQLELTTNEQAELERCEAVIDRGLKTFVDVGNALLTIRDERLYREQWGTFEAYCWDRWGLKRFRAYELMEAATVVANVGNFLHLPAPERESHAAPLAPLEPDQQREAWAMAVETVPEGKKITGAHIKRVVEQITRPDHGIITCPACGELYDSQTFNHCPYCYKRAHGLKGWVEGLPEKVNGVPHVAHNSGNNEWYTPPEYIAAARQVMGDIDLDPASSEIANQTVQAKTFFSQEDDGLLWDWRGRVWMNPPYASNLIGLFADKLANHVRFGDVTEACILVNNATETAWFNTLLDVASCVCFIRGRVKFVDVDGNPSGAPLQGQVVLYIGPNVKAFGGVFSRFGVVLYAGADSKQGKSQTA